jgi:hypothetical protein
MLYKQKFNNVGFNSKINFLKLINWKSKFPSLSNIALKTLNNIHQILKTNITYIIQIYPRKGSDLRI